MESTVTTNHPTTSILELLLDLFFLVVKCIWSIVVVSFYLFRSRPQKCVSREIVLVTGAGHGIGRAVATKYASEGATVVCWDINKINNEETVKQIIQLGYSKVYGYVCNVGNPKNVAEVAKRVQGEVGDVTILVNNAGIARITPILDTDLNEIQQTFEVNTMAHFWTIKSFLPAMKRNNHGHIIAVCSLAGLFGGRNGTSYCTSKFAVRGLMEALYQELRVDSECNIKLTTIYPTGVDTGIFKKAVTRFPNFFPIITPKEAADYIVTAQKQNVNALSIPGYNLCLHSFMKILPIRAQDNILDFFDTYIVE